MGKLEQFNPYDEKYKKVADLPEDQQQNFADTEGGQGFVRKSVERDSEAAHEIALVQDKIIEALEKEITDDDRALADSISHEYIETGKFREIEADKGEKINQVIDYNILRYGNDKLLDSIKNNIQQRIENYKKGDSEISEEMHKEYHKQIMYDYRSMSESEFKIDIFSYSKKTEEVILNNLSAENLDAATTFFVDERFDKLSKEKILKKISESNERDIVNFYQKVLNIMPEAVDDSGLPNKLMELIKENPLLITEIFKKWALAASSAKDSDPRKMENLKWTAFNVGKYHIQDIINKLFEEKKYDILCDLLHSDCFRVDERGYQINNVDSDKALFDLARSIPVESIRDGKDKTDPVENIVRIFKFIASEEVFSEIVSDNGRSFSHLTEQDRERVIQFARQFQKVFKGDPEIEQFGKAPSGKEFNYKFVMGLPDDEGKYYIAWGNRSEYPNHKDLFRALEEKTGESFPDYLGGGGYMLFNKNNEGKLSVSIESKSDLYGLYSHRVLEKFREKIIDALRKEFNQEDIELEIKISGEK